jgi:two-component system, NarL family, response regulator DevR
MGELRPFDPEHKDESGRERISKLTPRERQVYRLLELAKTDKEIANTLGIAERTVHFHVSNTLRKLHLSRRIEIFTDPGNDASRS